MYKLFCTECQKQNTEKELGRLGETAFWWWPTKSEGSGLCRWIKYHVASSKAANQTGGQFLATSWCMDSGNQWQYAVIKTVGRKEGNETVPRPIKSDKILLPAMSPHIYRHFSRQREGHFCSPLVLTPTLWAELRSLAEVYRRKHKKALMEEVLREIIHRTLFFQTKVVLCPCFQHDGGTWEKVASVFL